MKKTTSLILTAFLVEAFVLLALSQMLTTSPVFDEVAHLPAGYSYLRWGDYRLNPEHPPLIKKLAALPLLLAHPWPSSPEFKPGEASGHRSRESEWVLKASWASALGRADAEWYFGRQFLFGIRPEALRRLRVPQGHSMPTTAARELGPEDFFNNARLLVLLGRLPCLALGVLLALGIYAWARELYGPAGAVFAAALYCFDPNFIANSGLVTTDVGGAALMFFSVYFLWRARRDRKALDVLGACVCFGLALAAKYSALLLVPIFLLEGIGWLLERPSRRQAFAFGGIFLGALLAGYAIIWASYGLRFSASRHPGEGSLPIQVLLDPGPGEEMPWKSRCIQRLTDAHALPEAYLYGLAYTARNPYDRAAFLLGRHRHGGWWYYFPATFLFKTPLPTLLALLAGVILGWRRSSKAELWFLLAPVAAYLEASMASHFNIGHRHLLPIYPFLFVLAGGLARPWERLPGRSRRLSAFAALGAVIASAFLVFAPPWRPALVYPHYLAYFNELAGGPRNGFRVLGDSNLDWGQDLEGLRRWLEARHEPYPINLCYFGTADPLYYGIPYLNMPGGYLLEGHVGFEKAVSPGYLAISATNLQGVYYRPSLREHWQAFLSRAKLVDTIGYSIFIYRL